MKSPNNQDAPRAGMALVVALCFLTLTAALVVGFMASSTTEMTSAGSFSSGSQVKMLSDSAVNVVIGQIQAATSRTNGAWASQPGMVRVYRSEEAVSSRLDALFKLYSSDKLIVSREDAATFRFADEMSIGGMNWDQLPAMFTDLNAPVLVQKPTATGNQEVARYPVLDPRAFTEKGDDNKPAVEGFELVDDEGDTSGRIARMPVRWIYVLRDGTLTAPTNYENNGRSAIWSQELETRLIPTKANPIVGRIAFWTDDETSKVNINTAGGHIWKQDEAWLKKNGYPGFTEDTYPGSYWDTPRFYNYFDRGGDLDQATGKIKSGHTAGLAISQPLQNEFQRYPGHPAVTSLGLVFQNYLNAEQIYKISPRLTGGSKSSLGGVNRLINLPYWDPAFSGDGPQHGQSLPVKVDRLYSSVDELLFSPETGTNGKRELNDTKLGDDDQPAGVLTPDLLDKTRFFLTAKSRSPELNLFGRPRVTIWPVDTEAARRTAEDELIAFCSTVGPTTDRRPFIFQRHNPYDATADANIPRNRQVYDYLRDVTSKPIPGFTENTFLSKYQADRNQILTEIFDYIRCTNLRDSSRTLEILKAHGNPPLNTGAGSPWNNAQLEVESKQFAPRGIVLPIRINRDGAETVGFGRISTVNQAALVLYHAGYIGTNPANGQEIRYLDPYKKDQYGVRSNLIRAFILLETYNPMQGYSGVRNAVDAPKRAGKSMSSDIEDNNIYIHEMTGLDAFTVKSSSMAAPVNLGFPRRTRNRLGHAAAGWHSRRWGGFEGFSHTIQTKASWIPSSSQLPSDEYYPFQTDFPGVAIPANDETLDFSGGTVNLQVFFGNKFGRNIVLNFPPANWPVPTDDIWSDEGGFDRTLAQPSWKWAASNAAGIFANELKGNPNDQVGGDGLNPVKSFAGRTRWFRISSDRPATKKVGTATELVEWRANRWRNIIQPGDTIRSLVAAGNVDPRVTAMSTSTTVFEPHHDYFTFFYPGINGPDGKALRVRHAHSLRTSAGVNYISADAGDSTGGTWRSSSQRRGTYGGYWPLSTTHPQQYTDYPAMKFGNMVALPSGQSYPSDKAANLPPSVNGVTRGDGQPGDFDTGIANLPDGAFAGKADEGTQAWGYWDSNIGHIWQHPYYTDRDTDVFDSFFAANRQVSSAVMFGSLLAGRTKNWETLSFSPIPAGNNHRGNASSPPDHLLLDLFTMPIVRPYAISEPFSTAGKVNMNYQIVPFTHIKRTTALRAALESVRVPAVGIDQVGRYKSSAGTTNYRHLVDRNEVVKSFDDFFAQFDRGNVDEGFFKSASQICERFLYPRTTVSGRPVMFDKQNDRYVRAFWDGKKLTGDNLRERPYADLYARLTTKSNTFTVHYQVQVLRKRNYLGSGDGGSTHYARWDEGQDAMVAEQRGSSLIERYLDPEDRRFNSQDNETLKNRDYLDPDKESLDRAYRFRVVSSRRFLPR